MRRWPVAVGWFVCQGAYGADVGINGQLCAYDSIEEALVVLERTGLPAIIRPSFTMGGTGGGVAYNKDEFLAVVAGGLDASPTTEVLIEESLIGWKEYEMEVVRDRNDNAIIICSIENVDPMGVHTGDSITVAPALTLTDKEYQIMRNASIACLREIGVETGGSNVQFAVNPKDGRLIVIEMNPRVSRSSALASKATGFPIAKVAARLADDQVVLVKAKAEVNEEGKAKLLVSELLPLEQAKLAEARFVTIRVPIATWNRGKGEKLRDILESHRGDCPVTLELIRPGSYAVAVAPSTYYKVRPDTILKDELESLLGPGSLVLARTIRQAFVHKGADAAKLRAFLEGEIT